MCINCAAAGIAISSYNFVTSYEFMCLMHKLLFHGKSFLAFMVKWTRRSDSYKYTALLENMGSNIKFQDQNMEV